MQWVSIRAICFGACPCLVISFLPEGYYSMEKILVELGKALIPDVLNPANHTELSFVCSIAAVAIYGTLMLNDDEVYNWKKGLQWAVGWMLVSVLAVFLATGEFTKIEAGETYSKLFIVGMLFLSIIYVVISIRVWWVRDSCLVQSISTLIAIGHTADCYWFASILIQS